MSLASCLNWSSPATAVVVAVNATTMIAPTANLASVPRPELGIRLTPSPLRARAAHRSGDPRPPRGDRNRSPDHPTADPVAPAHRPRARSAASAQHPRALAGGAPTT